MDGKICNSQQYIQNVELLQFHWHHLISDKLFSQIYTSSLILSSVQMSYVCLVFMLLNPFRQCIKVPFAALFNLICWLSTSYTSILRMSLNQSSVCMEKYTPLQIIKRISIVLSIKHWGKGRQSHSAYVCCQKRRQSKGKSSCDIFLLTWITNQS